MKWNIKYINEDKKIIFEGNYKTLHESVQDLREICPLITLRRIQSIKTRKEKDKLFKYVKISLNKPDNDTIYNNITKLKKIIKNENYENQLNNMLIDYY